ncbi:Metal tolerance protein [Arachis hypogaea]|nr:Metal tolerance protein [Arachis hypogaea]
MWFLCLLRLHSLSFYLRTSKVRDFGSSGNLLYALGTAGGIACHAVDILMELFSSGPEMVSHAVAHEHVHSHGHGGHHHGIDMEHPILALNMTILSICIKKGFTG